MRLRILTFAHACMPNGTLLSWIAPKPEISRIALPMFTSALMFEQSLSLEHRLVKRLNGSGRTATPAPRSLHPLAGVEQSPCPPLIGRSHEVAFPLQPAQSWLVLHFGVVLIRPVTPHG